MKNAEGPSNVEPQLGVGGTVLGVPLEPGETVIGFEKASYKADKIVFWILALVFLVAIVGIVFIFVGIFWERWQARGVVVTKRRVIAIDRKGIATSTALTELAVIEAERQQGSGGESLIGSLVSAGVDAALDHSVAKNPKEDPAYWKRTVAIMLVLKGGRAFAYRPGELPSSAPSSRGSAPSHRAPTGSRQCRTSHDRTSAELAKHGASPFTATDSMSIQGMLHQGQAQVFNAD